MPTLLPLLFSLNVLALHPNYHGFSPLLFAGFIIISCMFGDTIDYYTGAFSEQLMMKWRWVRRFVHEEDIKKGEAIFKDQGPTAIVMMSCVPVLHSAVSLAAGAVHYSYAKFISINTGTNIALVICCMILSHYFGYLPIVKDHLIICSFLMVVILLLIGTIAKKLLVHRDHLK